MLVTITASGQDLLASHAPVDRKLRTVDTLVLQKFFSNESLIYNAAEELYDNWSNSITHYKSTDGLPGEFTIDLRDFTMPTDNRVITSGFGTRWNR